MRSNSAIILAASILIGSLGAAEGAIWKRFLLPTTHNGKCLDGSPGGYWVSPGAERTKYLVHLQGGGWCISDDDCLARSQTALGSSTTWAANETTLADGGDHGFFNRNATYNPVFHNWTLVYIGYCDGGSYAGYVDHAVSVNATRVFYRGRAILGGIMEELLLHHGVNAATDFVLAGTSAGGLGVYLHADRIGTLLPSTTKYRAMPGAGMFMATMRSPITGTFLYQQNYLWVFKAMNASAGVDQDCIPGMPDGYKWKCFLAPVMLPYITTPLFVVNALQDSWQATNILGVRATCNPTTPSTCSAAELSALTALSRNMITAVNDPVILNPTNGAFMASCFTHCMENVDVAVRKLTVAGQTLSETFAAWYSGNAAVNRTAIDGPALNPTCPVGFCGAK